jgi:lysophospholipase L1-like esterase
MARMTTARKLLLGLLGGGGTTPIVYLFRDEFTTDLAAGSVNGTASEPGPGMRTVTDTENKLAISGSVLACAGPKAAAAWGDPGVDWGAAIFPVNRVMGVTLRQRSNITYSGRVGFKNGATAFANATFIECAQALVGIGSHTVSISLNTWYQYLLISSAERSYLLIKGGAYAAWRLAGVTKKNEQANLIVTFTGNSWIGDLDDLAVYDTSGWGEYGPYTAAVLGITGPWSVTGAADGFMEFTWIPQTAETLDFAIRQLDTTHRLIVRCNQAGSTIKLMQDDAGETELATAAQTLTVNTLYTVRVYLSGTTVQAFVNEVRKINTTSAFNQTQTGVNVTGATVGRDLIVWPLTYADGVITQTAARQTVNILPYGDSKTAGAGETSYVPFLCRGIGTFETPTRIAVGGRSTASAASAVAAELAAASGTPNYICYNLGANDVTSLPAEATWKANTAAILDAMHTKWPSAQIYLARPWRRSYAAECNTLATWQDAVMATRAWAHVGPDERVFLENGDDGARYTSDGVHPTTPDGYILTAAAWKTAMGL